METLLFSSIEGGQHLFLHQLQYQDQSKDSMKQHKK